MRRAPAALILLLTGATTMAQPPALLDDFSDPAAWHVGATDDVRAALRPVADGLCVDYDFGRVSGYVTLRRPLPIDYPARYGFELDVRGDAVNTLQFKLVDASGENVWWVPKPAFRWPADWQRLKLRQRQVDFAWGPTTDRTLRRSAAVELVIVSGTGASKGSACFRRLAFQRLPDVAPPIAQPVLSTDGADFGLAREFDTLDLRWPAGTAPSAYGIEFSDDGVTWRRVRTVERARGDLQSHWLPDSETRRVRVVGDGLAPLAAIEPAAAPTANAFFTRLAARAPRGAYPRAYVGEQSYWTIFGVDGGPLPSLLSEDGTVEPVPGVGALEPMLVVDGRVRTWADAGASHRLREGDLPMPSVTWRLPADALALDVEAFGAGTPAAAQALARYRVTNHGDRRRTVGLALAWRPFQANPPTQFLAHPGGASTLARLDWDGERLAVDGVARLRPLSVPSAVRIEPLAAGPVGEWLAAAGDTARGVVDPAGFASAGLRWDLDLDAGETREIDVALPVVGDPGAVDVPREAERVAAHWRDRLSRVRIDGPPEVAALAETVRSALGHILVNRSGAALQPGPRAYARSWIRDGALTSSALLRLGEDDVVRDFLTWYAPFQFSSGKVPCCATAAGGADPVPENDSDGEFIHAVADYWRQTRDDATARALWPRVEAAAEHMEALRAGERSDANRTPARRAYFGLMPPSISHEGYSDKPAYAYWDDFWTAIGDRGAVQLATGLGFADAATRLAARRAVFLADLDASLVASTRQHGLSVVPGAADRGDVDPTSTTIALAPGGLLGVLPEPLLRATFDRYWRDFVARRDGAATWSDYTPYEWRNVGAFVRLGDRDRALAAIDFFRADRRPAGWNQWAEVVMRQPREPHFLGDMPHGWVASDQIRSVLDLFAHEREADEALVLGAGVPMRWLGGRGIRVDGLRTPFGRLGLAMRSHRAGVRTVVDVEIGALRETPPGGVVLRGPWPATAEVRVDGRRRTGPADAIRIDRTPAVVRVVLPAR